MTQCAFASWSDLLQAQWCAEEFVSHQMGKVCLLPVEACSQPDGENR